jgi:hypothetical protein
LVSEAGISTVFHAASPKSDPDDSDESIRSYTKRFGAYTMVLLELRFKNNWTYFETVEVPTG